MQVQLFTAKRDEVGDGRLLAELAKLQRDLAAVVLGVEAEVSEDIERAVSEFLTALVLVGDLQLERLFLEVVEVLVDDAVEMLKADHALVDGRRRPDGDVGGIEIREASQPDFLSRQNMGEQPHGGASIGSVSDRIECSMIGPFFVVEQLAEMVDCHRQTC